MMGLPHRGFHGPRRPANRIASVAVPMWILVGGVALSEPATLRVTVSIPPQQWLVERIGVERVEVASLIGPGDSPATFQPSDAQVTSLMRSDIFFSIGVPYENGRWLQAVKSTGRVSIVDSRLGIDLRPVSSSPEGFSLGHVESSRGDLRSGLDPHIWLSPRLLRIQADSVTKALQRRDPESTDYFEENRAQLDADLDRLDRHLASKLEPYRGRGFLMFHPSWGYFASDYGLRQLAIEVEGKDPTDDELTEIQSIARDLGTQVVFVQPQIHSRAAEAVARAIGAKVVEIDPLAPDPIDNLSKVADLLVASFNAGAPD